MKTAISLSDRLFDDAERLAHGLGLSRSELYRRALEEYLARHAPDSVTAALDRLAERIDMHSEPFLSRAALRVMDRND